MTELTEAERELLEQIAESERSWRDGRRTSYFRVRNDENAAMVDGLVAKGLITCGPESMLGLWNSSLGLTGAGWRVLAEAKVADQFAVFDKLRPYPYTSDDRDRLALVELGRIVREQARRIAELEAKG